MNNSITNSIAVGRLVSYRGDMANHPRMGEILSIEDTRWGRNITVRLRAEGNSGNPEWDLAEEITVVSEASFRIDNSGSAAFTVVR